MSQSKLKICVASSGLGHVARGIEAWASDLGKALADRGEQVLLCKGAGEVEADYERLVPCWTRESTKTRHLLTRMPKFLGWRLGMGNGYGIEQTTYTWNLIKLLRKEQVDVLHVQDPIVALLVQRAKGLGLVKARTILAHGTEEPLEFQKRIHYLQHLAPWHLEEAKQAGVWKPSWTAIPNFIDTDLFQPGSSEALRAELGVPQDAVVVLTAAAIKRHHKRIDHLLGEFEEARRLAPELPLWLVVAGGWEADTDELVEEGKRRLGDRVRFLVRFPRVRMPELYRMANIFTLCSLKEMMPIALIEATASGLPCLVNQHPVMEWMIGPGGKSVDMSIPGELAKHLVDLGKDGGYRAELGQKARQHCVGNFSRDAVVDQILRYYQVVCEKQAREIVSA